MPSIEYTIIGNHPIFKYVNEIFYTKSVVQSFGALLVSLGYEVEIKERKLI